MLVLSRKVGESVVIGGNVRVVVVGLKGGKVRLAFDAPDGVVVDRLEVHQRRREFADDGGSVAGVPALAGTA